MTQDGKWTKGPWEAEGQDTNEKIIVYSQWGEVARVPCNGCYKQRDANARLIAAAPELLAELERSAGQLHEVVYDLEAISKAGNFDQSFERLRTLAKLAINNCKRYEESARAVLAKAKGEEQ